MSCRIAAFAAGVLILAAACAQEPTGGVFPRGSTAGADSTGITGSYFLMSVDGRLPSAALPDSGGGTVTVLEGHLTLGKAPPETYVATPAGLMAGSCVHEIPNGARVDTANVVHLPDGTSYKIPPCGDGPYTLVLNRRFVAADGVTRVATDSTAGLYTWSKPAPADSLGMVTLVGAGLGGSISFAGGPVLRIARLHNGMRVPEPVYLFAVPGGDKGVDGSIDPRSSRPGG